jgi:uncharacterized protein (DUF169 family)
MMDSREEKNFMDLELKGEFSEQLGKYFGEQEFPIVFYCTNQKGCAELVKPPSGYQCFIGLLAKVRKGSSLCFDVNSIGCSGGKRYLGFTEESMA